MLAAEAPRGRWIWCSETDNKPNQYIDFYSDFHSQKNGQQWLLRISTDSNFVAWVNGKFVGTGQFGDFPDDRTYSQIDITSIVRPGNNILMVQVHYCGIDHFSYTPGNAGLWYELIADGEVVSRSDRETICRPSPNYTDEGTSRITPQRGFTFHYIASHAPVWLDEGDRTDETWRSAIERVDDRVPRLRPLPMLDTGKSVGGSIIAQGLIKRKDESSFGRSVQHDYLSARRPWELFSDFAPNCEPIAGPIVLDESRLEGADGFYLLYDLGQEKCGFVDFALTSSGRCVIDIAVGEHIDDLRVRAHVGGREFASRYVACAGEQRFTHWHHRYAGRYIQVHITEVTGMLQLERVGLVVAEYPVSEVDPYIEMDSLANQIWLTARRTLHLCMFEHYEDCPWREQALYGNDSRSQMLFGYYAFCGYDFPRESLGLMLRTTGEDGYQELCAPMKFNIKIPGFTMTWFLALRDYFMYSGDNIYIDRVMPQVKQMLAGYESTVVNDLLPSPRGKGYWYLYDWAPGLDGTVDGDCTRFECVEGLRFDAPLNGLWIMALLAMAEVAAFIGDTSFSLQCSLTAKRAAAAMHGKFYDPKKSLYQTYAGENAATHYGELTQSLALLAGVAPEEIATPLRHHLVHGDEGLVPTTLSQSLYKFDAILQDISYGPAVHAMMLADWSKMLFAGATSFWETQRGGWDFNHAASLCHGWSGVPVYISGAYGLGIKPTKPGFKKIKVQPCLGVREAIGVVPTPHGNITIGLQKQGETYQTQLTLPNGVSVE